VESARSTQVLLELGYPGVIVTAPMGRASAASSAWLEYALLAVFVAIVLTILGFV
jgi:hypothetical protein